MKQWINYFFKRYYQLRYQKLIEISEQPRPIQERWRNRLLEKAHHTLWGKKFHFQDIHSYTDFSEAIPLNDYESLKPYIQEMMFGKKDILWKGSVKWFSKSSGTTNDKSKFIPVSFENLRACQIRGTWDTMACLYHNRPDAKQFEHKSMLMGGSLQSFSAFPKTTIGDVSAIMIHFMPSVAKPFFIPDFETALLEDWEIKLEALAEVGSKKKNVVMIGGVPTWTLVLLKRILEKSGKSNMLEVWPQFQAYIHGGVSFYPYQQQFEELFPSNQVSFQEIYNASEGYFAIQNDLNQEDLLLLVNNGIYYEFLPMSEWETPHPKTVPLWEVELGRNYAMVISTNSGLWRYMPGDTIKFTSKNPYKIKITGRTKQFINVFGEEVMVENTDKALAITCEQTQSIASDYTVAPIFIQHQQKGGHEWLIEFEKSPDNLVNFTHLLDQNLQRINSDYEAKRHKDIALQSLQVQVIPNGVFHDWLKSKGRLGGQSKIPRLSNNRNYLDEILSFIQEQGIKKIA